MCSSNIELKYSEGNRSVEFKLTGFTEVTAQKVMHDILNSFNGSKPLEEKKKEFTLSHEYVELRRKNTEEIKEPLLEEPKDIAAQEVVEDEKQMHFDTDKFQAYYICKCGDRGKHYIERSQIHINCWNCGKRMQVRDAHIQGFPMKDDFGNTYIAGEFKRSDEIKYGAYI